MTAENLARVMSDESLCEILKNDVSATVGIVRGDVFGLPFPVCIKRFPARGFAGRIVRFVFLNRARHLWEISKSLSAKGLPVPAPVAFFSTGMKKQDAFFIAQAIENAENLGTMASRGQFEPTAAFTAALAKTMARWHTAGAVHGDLKWSNILFRQEEGIFRFYFIDLDQARLYPAPTRRGICRDLARFYRYGLELGQEEWVENLFFPRYLSAASLPPDISHGLTDVVHKARQDWIKKGSRKIGPG